MARGGELSSSLVMTTNHLLLVNLRHLVGVKRRSFKLAGVQQLKLLQKSVDVMLYIFRVVKAPQASQNAGLHFYCTLKIL